MGYITRTMRKIIKDYIKEKLPEHPFWHEPDILGRHYKNVYLLFGRTPTKSLNKRKMSHKCFGLCINRASRTYPILKPNPDVVMDKLIKKYKPKSKYNLKNITIEWIDECIRSAEKINNELELKYKYYLSQQKLKHIADDFS